MSGFCSKPCLKASAFKIIYLVAFVFSLMNILGSAFANLQLGQQIGEFIEEMSGLPKILNLILSLAAIFVFAFAISTQFFRIYVTLEMLEETEWMRDAYFKRLSVYARVVEFLIRLLIIFLGSMTAVKIFHIRFNDPETPWVLPFYLTLFYSTLVTWSLLIRRLTAIKIWTFLKSDVPMFIGCIFLTLLAYYYPTGKDLLLIYVIIYLVLGGFLLWSLFVDFLSKGGFYLYTGHFFATAISVWRGTIQHEDAEMRMPGWIRSRYPIIVAAHKEELDQLLAESELEWQKREACRAPRRSMLTEAFDWCATAMRRVPGWQWIGRQVLSCFDSKVEVLKNKNKVDLEDVVSPLEGEMTMPINEQEPTKETPET